MSRITHEFRVDERVVFNADGSVDFQLIGNTMSKAQFAEFMPTALHVYHRDQMGNGMVGGIGPAQGSTRKPGRPRGSKSTSAKKAARKSVAK